MPEKIIGSPQGETPEGNIELKTKNVHRRSLGRHRKVVGALAAATALLGGGLYANANAASVQSDTEESSRSPEPNDGRRCS